MSKIRIYELAKQLGVTNKDLMAKLKSIEIEASSHMSVLEAESVEKVKKLYAPKDGASDKNAVQKDATNQGSNKPAQNQGGNRPAQNQGGNRPAQNQGSNRPAQNQGGNRPAQNQGGNRPAQNQGGNRPAQNQGGNRPAQNQGGNKDEVKKDIEKKDAPRQQPNAPVKKDDKNAKGNKKDDRNAKGNKKDQRPKENPIERRRREREEEAALMAELEALEAEERAANPEPVTKTIPETTTVKDLAEVLGKKGSDLVMNLMKKGKMMNINAALDFETAATIALEYNVILEKEIEADIMETVFAEEEEDDSLLEERPPVVVVMGHVDHGKTSLLDAIRHSDVTKGEAGGITQHIGAYTVQIAGKPITFLDTPGHEAFTAMRMRGAQITDIAILVVAADDGVMPQTVEAINHAKAAGVEIIVAINKMDKPSANPDRVKQELTEFQLLAEDWGGETICVPVSAATKDGIDTLLEMITLVAEMKELRANPNKNARGVIIEAQLDKGRGPVATVLVQGGTLQVGDPIVAGCAYGKIRAMTDDKGRRVKKAGPSTPVEILGLSEVPTAGDGFYVAENDKQARQVAESIVARNRENLIKDTPQKVSLDDLFSQIQSGNMKELNIVVKADVQGSVEAVRQSLERLSNEEVRVRIIHGGVGAITESDVMLASASNAIIIGFNVRPEPAAKAFGDEEKVDIRLYRVIYNAIEDVTAAMKGMLDPVFEEKVLGHAEIRQLFKASGVGTIAGSYVKDGKFIRNCKVRILRDNIVVYEGDLESLKRFKDDVKEVAAGYECGLVFKKFNDLKEGDWVEAFTMVEVPR
ncbi:translation initiation factor IF-2 [Anaerotignum propionicum]|uniref:Translation initiation factor IF-2 n=1 Tax=Anaerotignum propionicum DSM 1682 TaxID=991789 RepID=A0A0X8VBV8_ANAPI|nr:translation initiation factor IF-2 [Anaerotignum propionicum]AMJ42073.1 translation initiation factor IF-2 [Anaerotignum propionicum DSM 1682]SHE50830.1 bacterial translation initiation factor 2 (bIF-2) [[Clostridium] propionicum DSM 1682] [Anaerotignum propionicum DSM 1682]